MARCGDRRHCPDRRAGDPAVASQPRLRGFRHPPERDGAVCDLAQPAGRQHRHGVVRPRHVLRPRRLYLRADDADDRPLAAGRGRARGADHDLCRALRRRDLRTPQHRLFRLHHARGADAVLQRHHLLAEPHRRRPGPARRHSAPRDLRLRAGLAASSLSVLRGRGGARPAGAAPHHRPARSARRCA